MPVWDHLKENTGKVGRIPGLFFLSFALSYVAPVRVALGLCAVGGRELRKGSTLHDACQTSDVIGDLCGSLLFTQL